MSGLFWGCERNDELITENIKYNLYNPETDAQIKFIHSYAQVTPTAITVSSSATSGPGYRIFVDGVKINGATNTSTSVNVLFYGGVFPATTAYTTVPAGQRNFKFTINRVSGGNFAPIAGDEVFNKSITVNAGKQYSFFLADTIPNPSIFVVEDNIDFPNKYVYGIRFANLSPEPSKRYDLSSLKNGRKLFTDLGYKDVSNYIYLNTGYTDTLSLTLAGTNTVISTVTGFTPVPQRAYTFYARGKTGVSNRAPSLTFYTNR